MLAFVNIRDGETVFDTTKIDGKNLTSEDIDALNSLKSKNPDLKFWFRWVAGIGRVVFLMLP